LVFESSVTPCQKLRGEKGREQREREREAERKKETKTKRKKDQKPSYTPSIRKAL
jgi:hypothetical protein